MCRLTLHLSKLCRHEHQCTNIRLSYVIKTMAHLVLQPPPVSTELVLQAKEIYQKL